MSSKLSELKFKQVGVNLNVVIGDEPISVKITDKEEREALKDKMNAYTKKKTPALLKEIMAALKPETTEKKATKEKAVADIKAEIKKEKNAAKGAKDAGKAKKGVIAAVKEVAAKKVAKALPAAQKALPAAKAPKVAKETKDTLVDDLAKKLEAGTLTGAETDRLQALLNKTKKAPEPQASTGNRRSGEY